MTHLGVSTGRSSADSQSGLPDGRSQAISRCTMPSWWPISWDPALDSALGTSGPPGDDRVSPDHPLVLTANLLVGDGASATWTILRTCEVLATTHILRPPGVAYGHAVPVITALAETATRARPPDRAQHAGLTRAIAGVLISDSATESKMKVRFQVLRASIHTGSQNALTCRFRYCCNMS